MMRLGEDVEKKASVSERMNQSALRWFGHVKRMEDDRLPKKE